MTEHFREQSFNQFLDSNLNSSDRGDILTEKPNDNSHDLDLMSTYELVSLFSQEDLKPQIAISKELDAIARAIDLISSLMYKGGRMFYLGAGTSGRIGVLDAAECPPTFCTDPELVQGIIAGGHKSLYRSSEDLEDVENLAIEDLKSRNFSSKDSLIGLTAGGTTPYVHSGINYARKIKALSIFISCVHKETVSSDADIDIRLITGPEIITGSTRLKAGTATKMILNIISSCVMIKLGKVYSNRMVDLSVSNSKLIDRSLRILKDLAGLTREEAIELLKKSDGSVKLALFITLSGLEIEFAKELLDQSKGNLRLALNNINLG